MKRWLKRVMILAIIVAAIGAGSLFGLGYYLSPQSPLAKADAVVAISGGDTAARTDEAVRLYRDKWAPEVIFSGAALDPNSPSNAAAMAKLAEEQGVPAAAIIKDEAAANTRQNAAGVAAIAHQRGYRTIILVTSPYHQRRANIAFQRELDAGVTIINHSSYDQTWRRSHWWATAYSRELTLSELQKVLYELASGHGQ